MRVVENKNYTVDLKDLTFEELDFIYDSLIMDKPGFRQYFEDNTKKLARKIKNQFLEEHFKQEE